MSWQAVAEKDFRDAMQSRLLIGLTALFVLFAAGIAYDAFELRPPPEVRFGAAATTFILIRDMVNPVSVFVPLVAIAAAYRSIAGERQSGSLKILLSLPNSRVDIVVGKFLGRAGVVAAALLLGFAIGMVTTAFLADDFAIVEYLAFVSITLLLAFVFVSIAVGVSAFTKSTFWAGIGAFGIFVLFQFLWPILALGAIYALNGFEFPGADEQLAEWLQNLFDVLLVIDPTTAYRQGVLWVVRLLAEDQEAQQAAADAPFYVQDWFGFVVLAFWIVLPLAIGYLRFESSDL